MIFPSKSSPSVVSWFLVIFFAYDRFWLECLRLIGHMRQGSVIKRSTDSTTGTTSGQTDTTSGQTSATNGQTNGQMNTTSGQTSTVSEQTSATSGHTSTTGG